MIAGRSKEADITSGTNTQNPPNLSILFETDSRSQDKKGLPREIFSFKMQFKASRP